MKRKTKNIGEFAHLQEPMQLRHVEKIAKKYDIDTKDLTIKIQRDVTAVNLQIYGSSDPKNIGRIDLLPLAFSNEEELARTIYHEKIHVEQFKKYGSLYVMENRQRFEIEASRLEEEWVGSWRK
ncbi:hypothetical protein AGMMS49975_30080 [Clostridia bacterium]|nr:hypothetical protein AGMMS49975_30080 [Clostridia bacterium]